MTYKQKKNKLKTALDDLLMPGQSKGQLSNKASTQSLIFPKRTKSNHKAGFRTIIKNSSLPNMEYLWVNWPRLP